MKNLSITRKGIRSVCIGIMICTSAATFSTPAFADDLTFQLFKAEEQKCGLVLAVEDTMEDGTLESSMNFLGVTQGQREILKTAVIYRRGFQQALWFFRKNQSDTVSSLRKAVVAICDQSNGDMTLQELFFTARRQLTIYSAN